MLNLPKGQTGRYGTRMEQMNGEWDAVSAQLHGSFLDRQIGRTNRNLLLASLFLIIGVACYGVAQWRYFYNFCAGPFQVDGTWLENVKHPDSELRYFVKIQGDES